MGKLNIAHHKSYHPYRADNIARVKKDEEKARLLEEQEERRTLQADSEARLNLLRQRAKGKGKGKLQDEGEAALERHLTGPKAEGEEKEDEVEDVRASIVPAKGKDEGMESIELGGHINFWADLERGVVKPTSTKANKDYEKEKKDEDDKWDSHITMYLGKPAKELKPWYTSTDLVSGEERKRTEEQRLEIAYKDGNLKRLHDPLLEMNLHLTRREEIIAFAEKERKRKLQDPLSFTPIPPRKLEETPRVSLLGPKKWEREKEREREKARKAKEEMKKGKGTEEDVDETEFYVPERPPPRAISTTREQSRPDRPSPSSSKSLQTDIQSKTVSRESSERARAQALIAAAKAKKRQKKQLDTPSTVRSEVGEYGDVYNRDETRMARLARVRWGAEGERERDEERAWSRRRGMDSGEGRKRGRDERWDREADRGPSKRSSRYWE